MSASKEFVRRGMSLLLSRLSPWLSPSSFFCCFYFFCACAGSSPPVLTISELLMSRPYKAHGRAKRKPFRRVSGRRVPRVRSVSKGPLEKRDCGALRARLVREGPLEKRDHPVPRVRSVSKGALEKRDCGALRARLVREVRQEMMAYQVRWARQVRRGAVRLVLRVLRVRLVPWVRQAR